MAIPPPSSPQSSPIPPKDKDVGKSAKQVSSKGGNLTFWEYSKMTGLFHALVSFSSVKSYPRENFFIAKQLAKKGDVNEFVKILNALNRLKPVKIRILKKNLNNEKIILAIQNATPYQKYAIIQNPSLIETVLLPRLAESREVFTAPTEKRKILTTKLENLFSSTLAKSNKREFQRIINATLSLMDEQQIDTFLKMTETDEGKLYLSEFMDKTLPKKIDAQERPEKEKVAELLEGFKDRLTFLCLAPKEKMDILMQNFARQKEVDTLFGNRLTDTKKGEFLDGFVSLGMNSSTTQEFQEASDHYSAFLTIIQDNRPQVRTRHSSDYHSLFRELSDHNNHLKAIAPFTQALMNSLLLTNPTALEFGIQGFTDQTDSRGAEILKSMGKEGVDLSHEIHRTEDGYLEIYVTNPITMESTCVRKKLPLQEGLADGIKNEHLKILENMVRFPTFEKAYTSSHLQLENDVKQAFERFIKEFERDIARAISDFNTTETDKREFALSREAFVNLAESPSIDLAEGPSTETKIAACKERCIFQLDDGSLSLLPEEQTLSKETLSAAENAFVNAANKNILVPFTIFEKKGEMKFDLGMVNLVEGGPSYLALDTTITLDGKTITRRTLYPFIEGQSAANITQNVIHSKLFEQHLLLAIAEAL